MLLNGHTLNSSMTCYYDNDNDNEISLFDINHLNTMIRENTAEKNNVVNEQETIQNNIECRYRKPTP